ncbi:hypothetical protein Syun_030755 [Stephania yunnanensis]|uniref:Uncharacterized protein n=1 Tax=Stephania yunnanensis TaxID=152371 RepID=A0AAP0DVA8_9MAGN
MKMQPQIFLKSSSSSMEGFVPPNYEFQLGRLAAHDHQRHRELCGRVIFSDPCAQCGNKKRRLLTFEAETISASAIPTPPPPSSPADIFRRWNSCPSTNSPATAPLPTPDPASMKRSLSDVTPAPASRVLRWNPASIASGTLISPTFLMSSRESTPYPRIREGEQNDDLSLNPQELCICKDDINNDQEENCAGEEVAERDSELGRDTVTFLHKCPCGKKFQFFVLVKAV